MELGVHLRRDCDPCGIIALTDNWLWPDPAEAILLEALADVLRRIRGRLVVSTSCYLAADPAGAAHLRSICMR